MSDTPFQGGRKQTLPQGPESCLASRPEEQEKGAACRGLPTLGIFLCLVGLFSQTPSKGTWGVFPRNSQRARVVSIAEAPPPEGRNPDAHGQL